MTFTFNAIYSFIKSIYYPFEYLPVEKNCISKIYLERFLWDCEVGWNRAWDKTPEIWNFSGFYPLGG